MHHVIIIETDFLLTADFVGILEEAGHNVVGGGEDLNDALSIAEVTHADLVFIDVDAIGEDESLNYARILVDRHHISAVFIGNNLAWEFMQDCRYYRPTGFIQKPYTASAIEGVFAREATSSIAPVRFWEKASAVAEDRPAERQATTSG